MSKPPLETAFPRWRKLSKLPDEVWKAPYDPASSSCFELILFAIGKDQTARGMSSEACYALSSEIICDLLNLQSTASSEDERVKLEYIQFDTSAFSLHVAINNGESGQAFNWINSAVDAQVSEATERSFDCNRFLKLLTTSDEWVTAHRTVAFQQWFGNFYYYCRNLAALHSVANELMPYAIKTLAERKPSHSFVVTGVLFALNWATAYQDQFEPLLAKLALTYFNDDSLPISLRAQICIAFLTNAARLTEKTPAQWARWALEHASGELNPNDTLLARLTVIETVEDWESQRSNVLKDIDAIALQLQARFPHPTAFVQRLDQAVKLLDVAIFKLHSFARSDALLEVLCHWYGVPVGSSRTRPILFCLPNHALGMAYLGQEAHMFDHDAPGAIETLSATTSACLGVALTVAGQVELEAPTGRPGVPDNEMAANFDATVSRHYHLAELDPAEYETARALICIPGYPHPLQYMMQRAVGTCLPILSSLEEPLCDRVIRRAAIWFSGEDNYSAMEAEALAGLMGSAAVECTLMCGQDRTKEDFLAMYSDPQYDLIWVAGHGEYDRWDPRSPAILVGRESEVGIDELLALPIDPTNTGRRLLVLNICDSGASGVFGGMHKLGLASMLASCNQAVVGHLWPVDPLIAAGIGIKLARELMRQQGKFFEAFQETTASLQMPWETFIRSLTGEDQFSIFDRLRNNERDLSNIFHAGSTVFFE